MVSDRGDVETVGAARSLVGQDDVDRAVCVCGSVVSWPRKTADVQDLPTVIPSGALASAHPRHLATCIRDGHDPLNGLATSRESGRLVTVQSVCTRCGFVYATEALV